MGKAIDLLHEEAFVKVQQEANGKLLLDYDFNMNIFKPFLYV